MSTDPSNTHSNPATGLVFDIKGMSFKPIYHWYAESRIKKTGYTQDEVLPAQITTPPAFSILFRSSLLFGLWSSERGIAVKHEERN